MKYIALVLLVLSIIFPLFHLINVLRPIKRKTTYNKNIIHSCISILIPCFNEMKVVETSIKGLNYIDYDNYEVIYINDGSTDLTFQLLNRYLELVPETRDINPLLDYKHVRGFYRSSLYKHIYVIDKENGGKADSLNAGLDYSTNELIVTLDADSVLSSNSLTILNNTFADEQVVAGGGLVKVLQSFDGESHSIRNVNSLIKLQTLEYLKGFFILKSSLSRINAMQIISGSFGIFRKQILLDVKGYRNTIGEDIDMTIKIQRAYLNDPDKTLVFIPNALCYTECPESFNALLKQRIRWQKAFIDCMVHYKGMLLKNFFRSPLAFFMIMDSFLVGTVATFFTIGSLLLLLLFTNVFKTALLIYFVVSTSIYLLHNIAALHISDVIKDCHHFKNRLSLIKIIIIDILFWRFINCLFIIAGTVLYPFNKKWVKIERTGAYYDLFHLKKGSFENK